MYCSKPLRLHSLVARGHTHVPHPNCPVLRAALEQLTGGAQCQGPQQTRARTPLNRTLAAVVWGRQGCPQQGCWIWVPNPSKAAVLGNTGPAPGLPPSRCLRGVPGKPLLGGQPPAGLLTDSHIPLSWFYSLAVFGLDTETANEGLSLLQFDFSVKTIQ